MGPTVVNKKVALEYEKSYEKRKTKFALEYEKSYETLVPRVSSWSKNNRKR